MNTSNNIINFNINDTKVKFINKNPSSETFDIYVNEYNTFITFLKNKYNFTFNKDNDNGSEPGKWKYLDYETNAHDIDSKMQI